MTDQATDVPALIVGVGASAGGLDALTSLLASCEPAEQGRGLAFVVVQHLDPAHDSVLADILARATTLDVEVATDGASLRANTVYVIEPGTQLSVRDHGLHVEPQPTRRSVAHGIDHFFESLADAFGEGCAGIVLSGTGRDGTAGLRHIKAAGGVAIAQDPGQAEHRSMPESALDAGLADLVLPVEEMAEALARYALHRSGGPRPLDPFDDATIDEVADILQAHEDFGLRKYKRATVERRIRRRVGLTGFTEPSPYLDLLRESAQERQGLVRDMMIGVTDFFRDPDAFEALEKEILPGLVEAKLQAGEPLRIWCAGCASGEEAYSLAILAHEAARAHGLEVQVFATDVDSNALATARAGVYPESIVAQVGEERLRAYFDGVEGQAYRVKSFLRNTVSFAIHDICVDPPFSQLDLVSCRNVLIYLRREMQLDVFKVFHFALRRGGHLFLGSSESTGESTPYFELVDKRYRIFRRTAARPEPLMRTSRGIRRLPGIKERRDRAERREATVAERARQLLVEGWAPPSVVIDEAGTVVFVHGDIGQFLHVPQGEPRLDLMMMLDAELRTRIRAAVYKCRRDGEPVVVEGDTGAGGERRVRATVRPSAPGAGLLSVAFETVQQHEPPEPADMDAEQEALVDQLERELAATREDLRNTVEELETSNEELRAANEESTSVNEELQSTNEELEATTEELRSLNEELTTVNAQLKVKVDQVQEAHDDLQNFFASTQLATLFLGESLEIKRFTPAARRLLELKDSDEKRSIEDLNRELLGHSLADEARRVLERLTPERRHVALSDGRHFDRRVLPYRSGTNRIEGVVVSFTDETELRRLTVSLERRELQQAVAAQLGLLGLRDLPLDELFDQTVRQVQRVLRAEVVVVAQWRNDESDFEVCGTAGLGDAADGFDSLPGGTASFEGFTAPREEPVFSADLQGDERFELAPALADQGLRSGIACTVGEASEPFGVVAAYDRERRHFDSDDATFLRAVSNALAATIARRRVEQRLEEGRRNFALALRHSPTVFYQCDTQLRYTWVGKPHPLFPANKVLGKRDDEVMPRERAKVAMAMKRKVLETGKGLRQHHSAELPTGREHYDITIEPLRDENGDIAGLTIAAHDITEQVELQERLAKRREELAQRAEELAISEARFRSIFDQAAIGIAVVDGEGTIVRVNQRLTEILDPRESELVGGDFLGWIVPASRDMARRSLAQAAAEGTSFAAELEMMRGQGGVVWTKVTSSAFRPHTADESLVVLVEDISERKRSEDALAEAAQHKDEFLAMLGHELRNPLAALRYSTDLLEAIAEEEPRLNRLQKVFDRQVNQMHRLVDDLLDVSRIARGKLLLQRETVDLNTVVAAVAEDATALFPAEGKVQLVLELPESPSWVYGDAARLAQAIDNLVVNAHKFTESGEVRVRVRRDEGEVVVEVADTGIGMNQALIDRIFEPFRQLKRTIDRTDGGLGLGLSIVRGVVELHGGTVGAESAGEGQGSTFWVRLTAAGPSTEGDDDEGAGEAKGPNGRRVLVVDDHQDSLEALQLILESDGHDVRVAVNGTEAIDLGRSFHPEVVICDIGLPGEMSGYDVARAFRADESLAGAVLVAITGYGRAEDKRRALDAGFDDHMAKPVSGAELRTSVRRLGRPG